MERLRLSRRARTKNALEIMSRLHRVQGRLDFLRSINEENYDVWVDDSPTLTDREKSRTIGIVLDKKEFKKTQDLMKSALANLDIDTIEQAYVEIVLPNPETKDKHIELTIQSTDTIPVHILSKEASWLISRMYKRQKPS